MIRARAAWSSRDITRGRAIALARRIGIGAPLAAFSASALGHVAAGGVASGAGPAVSIELVEVGLPVLVAGALYGIGVANLWRSSGVSRGLPLWRVMCFVAGLAVLVAALLSPLDRIGGKLFAFHMIQHELLMLVAAPLLVCGRPLAAWVWAFPRNARRWMGQLGDRRWLNGPWRFITSPLSAWTLHAIVLWVWHAPFLFEAALVDRGIHNLQHATFLLSALLFWFALLSARGREAQGAGVLYLFTTTVHTGVLGALITFATRPWYPHYVDTAPEWGLTALEDQQLGGLIMWVPASLVFVGFALVLFARWVNAGPAELAGMSRT
jgi:putative membrane protein